jgi:hypothetical protein
MKEITHCKFCGTNFAEAIEAHLLLVNCPEHNSPICPKCFACQEAGPILALTENRWLRQGE